MAWPFQLSVECGDDQTAAARLKGHFEEAPFELENGPMGRFCVDCVSQDEDHRWWASVLAMVGEKGLQHGDNPSLIAEAEREFYERLKSVSGYRFAVVGFDTFQFNTAESLPGLVGHSRLAGLVLSEALFERCGRPTGFVAFSPGYFWMPSDDKYG